MVLILIILAVAALVASQVYRALWHRRYLPPPGPTSGIVRLRGHLASPGAASARQVVWPLARGPAQSAPRAAELEIALDQGGSRQVRIDEDAPLFGTSRLRVGDRLTVDAIEVSILADEALYRQQARTVSLDAIRVMAGAWPRLGGLGTGCAGALLLLLAIGVVTESGPRTWLLRKTADKTICLRGTAREAVFGPQLLQRCVDRQGRRQGSYTIWDWSGTLRERGSYQSDLLHGVRDVLENDGSMLRATYRRGTLDGPTILLGPDARARRQTTYAAGVKHGVERLWHDNGQRAFVGYHAHGVPVGKWLFWTETGRQVAQATMRLGDERWTYFDRDLGGCPGDREVVERWLEQRLASKPSPCAIRCVPTARGSESTSVSHAACVDVDLLAQLAQSRRASSSH